MRAILSQVPCKDDSRLPKYAWLSTTASLADRPESSPPEALSRYPSRQRWAESLRGCDERPIRRISIMSGPRTTCQGSASGSSSMRRVNARPSSDESSNILQIDSSLATAHESSSTNRATVSPTKSITGQDRTAAHLRRPKASARSRRQVRTSAPVSFSNRSIF